MSEFTLAIMLNNSFRQFSAFRGLIKISPLSNALMTAHLSILTFGEAALNGDQVAEPNNGVTDPVSATGLLAISKPDFCTGPKHREGEESSSIAVDEPSINIGGNAIIASCSERS